MLSLEAPGLLVKSEPLADVLPPDTDSAEMKIEPSEITGVGAVRDELVETFNPELNICRLCHHHLVDETDIVDHYFTWHRIALVNIAEGYVYPIFPTAHVDPDHIRCPICRTTVERSLHGVKLLQIHALGCADQIQTLDRAIQVDAPSEPSAAADGELAESGQHSAFQSDALGGVPVLSPNAGFPDAAVHSFLSSLPIPRQQMPLFVRLGACGIMSLQDLLALNQVTRLDPPRARDLLLANGLNYAHWITLRHHLSLLADGDPSKLEDDDGFLQSFLELCSPPLGHRLAVLTAAGMLGREDVHAVANSPQAHWPAMKDFLSSHGFTFVETLSFRRSLSAFSQATAVTYSALDAKHPLVTFFMTLQGTVATRLPVDIFGRVGLETADDLDDLCRLSDQEVEEVLDELSKEGLTWMECKAVRAGLIRRAEKYKSLGVDGTSKDIVTQSGNT
ncbi:hypothetical protein EIP91_002679 [Steccherinum ochraceum]|uniref:Uncharacterized protein n=1 Tax=Steccherinum ochraceum TaxID=92696 RepID=A0A4R0RFC0_9APHY|nr:hypothetical protein EIP91_002679 [Steccherinum ochraceum]